MTPSLLLAVLASGFIYAISPGPGVLAVSALAPPEVVAPGPRFSAGTCWGM